MHLQKHLKSVRATLFMLIIAQQNLAQVQSRLERHLEAWSTLTQALDELQSPMLAQALASHACDAR